MIHRVCDTNILYDLGDGKLSQEGLRYGNAKLYLTPTSVLELVSKITAFSLEQRKRAAKAALAIGAEMLPTSDDYLDQLWGLRDPCDSVRWKSALLALSSAASVHEATTGVADTGSGTIATLNLGLAEQWRALQYEAFADDMAAVVEEHVPGYRLAMKENKVRRATKTKRQQMRRIFASRAGADLALSGTWLRSIQDLPPPVPKLDIQRINAAREQLGAYCSMYLGYVLLLADGAFPQPNDLGDLDCFIYVRPGWQVATRERRWLSIAKSRKLESIVFDPMK